jgi:hypothetical protein
MTPEKFLHPGEGEILKGAVHAAVCGLALVCGVYNAAAWLTRRERHLGVNAVLYAGLAVWEAAHVRHHSRHRAIDRTVPMIPRCEEAFRQARVQRDRAVTPAWVDSPFAGASTASHEELAS